MGVAESVRQSTPTLIFFRCSLAFTPKRCSSSMMTSPRSLNLTSSLMMRWVPMRISTLPFGKSSKVFRIPLAVRKRESTAIFDGKIAHPFRQNFHNAAWPKQLSGQEQPLVCLPSTTALKAARMATSVFP